MVKTRGVKALVLVALVAVGCDSDDETTTKPQAVSTTNGIWENGLSTNGIWENGIWENGIWENGIWENGIWENGIWENGIWENGIWENGIWQTNPVALETLRSSVYTRKLLQYMYSCALPPGRTTTIDPGRAGACSTATAACVHDSDC